MDSILYQIKKNSPNIHDVLEKLSFTLYEQASVTIGVSQFNSLHFEEAIKAGFLEVKNESICFCNVELFKKYLKYHAVEQLNILWSDIGAFLEEYWRIAKFQIKGRFDLSIDTFEDIENEVLLLLVSAHKKDLSGLVIEASTLREDSKLGRSFQRLYTAYWKVLPEINPEIQDIAFVLDSMGTKFTGISLAPSETIEKLSRSSRDLAEELYELFLAREHMPASSLMFNVLVAIGDADIGEAHSKALLLSDREEPILQKVGVRALGSFDYRTYNREDLLGLTLNKLEELKAESNSEIVWLLVSAYEDLIAQTDKVHEIFVELAGSPNELFRQSCSFSLFRLARSTYREEWYKQSLRNFVQAHCLNAKELDTFDHCLEQCADDAPSFVVDLVEKVKLGTAFDAGAQAEDIAEQLSSTLIKLRQNHLPVLEAALTRWIASSEQRLHILAFSIDSSFRAIPVQVGSTLERNHEPAFKLSKAVLDTLDDQVIEYVAHRIVAYTAVDAQSMCNFLLSILQREHISEAIVDLVGKLLSGYALLNYPNEAKEFIIGRIKGNELTNLQRQTAQKALAEFQDYTDNRQALPILREFQISTNRAYLYRVAQQRKQKRIQDESESKSVLSQFMPKRLFLYGKTISWEKDTGFTEPQPLIPMSASAELPQGEFIDPVGQAFSRCIWMSEGLSPSEELTEERYFEEESE